MAASNCKNLSIDERAMFESLKKKKMEYLTRKNTEQIMCQKHGAE